MVERNDELGTSVEPTYIENPSEVFVYDTMVDYSVFQEATGREPENGIKDGISLVCEYSSQTVPRSGAPATHQPRARVRATASSHRVGRRVPLDAIA